jgi:hypothetical protein
MYITNKNFFFSVLQVIILRNNVTITRDATPTTCYQRNDVARKLGVSFLIAHLFILSTNISFFLSYRMLSFATTPPQPPTPTIYHQRDDAAQNLPEYIFFSPIYLYY